MPSERRLVVQQVCFMHVAAASTATTAHAALLKPQKFITPSSALHCNRRLLGEWERRRRDDIAEWAILQFPGPAAKLGIRVYASGDGLH
jgi:hypothetical protein